MNPTAGRIVHYILPEGPSAGQHRPAIIVRLWNGTPLLQLQVFTDASNVYPTLNDALPCPLWATSVKQDELGLSYGTWHWPERDDDAALLEAQIKASLP